MKPMLARVQAFSAILLLQANLALAAEPASSSQTQAAPQTAPAQIPFNEMMRRSSNPLDAYRSTTVPPPNMANSVRLGSLVRDGKIYLSLDDAVSLALENNLDLVIARYNLPIAQTDV